MVRRAALAAALGACFATGVAIDAAAQPTPSEVSSGAGDRRELHVTAYRGYPPFAFVREVREVDLPSSRQLRLSLADVPDTVRRETVGLRVIDGAPLEVTEQTYGYDLFTPEALMRAAQGEGVVFDHANAHTGNLVPVQATVIASGNEGAVVRAADGYTFGVAAETTRLSRVPPGMTTRPTLRWLASDVGAGKRKLEVSYLVNGMSWSADYVATLSRDGSRLELASWLTFKNGTSVRLENVQLGVVAGTVHQAANEQMDMPMAQTVAMPETAARRLGPIRERISELHLYKVQHLTTLDPRETKNIRLFSLSGVPVRRRWLANFFVHPEHSAERVIQRPVLELELTNDKASRAGVPLPAGTVRIMAPDARGTAHMVASTSILDTPEGEKLKLEAGRVGDVVCSMIKTSSQSAWFGSRTASWKLELRNRGRTAGLAQVDLHAPGNVEIQVRGATTSRPTATVVRLEIQLAPGQIRSLEVEARSSQGGAR